MAEINSSNGRKLIVGNGCWTAVRLRPAPPKTHYETDSNISTLSQESPHVNGDTRVKSVIQGSVFLMGLHWFRQRQEYDVLATRQAIDVKEAKLVTANESTYALAA